MSTREEEEYAMDEIAVLCAFGRKNHDNLGAACQIRRRAVDKQNSNAVLSRPLTINA